MSDPAARRASRRGPRTRRPRSVARRGTALLGALAAVPLSLMSLAPQAQEAQAAAPAAHGFTVVSNDIGMGMGDPAAPAPTLPPGLPVDEARREEGTCTGLDARFGQYGELVRAAQELLGLPADGVFGDTTRAAVRELQRRSGLPDDGVIGERTWQALGGYPCGTPPLRPNAADPPLPPSTVDSSRFTGADVMRVARRYIGIDYVYGGTTPAGFDCSGLTQYVFRQVGIDLPRGSWQQAGSGPSIDLADLRPGDLVFFYTPVRHVAIYAGNGQVLDAPRPGTKVSIRPMTATPVKALRFLAAA